MLTLQQVPPIRAVRFFCELLVDELAHRRGLGLPTQSLRRYYRNLRLADGVPNPLGIHGYASRLTPALLSMREMAAPVRLLDAGCGYGTESLLFGMSGANVTGVDVVSDRVNLARSRLDYYQTHASEPLSVRFVNADILRYLDGAEVFDVIWVMEAISHIHPLEAFLPLAYECLRPGGLLITSDPNALNPVVLYRACRIRGAVRYTLRMKAKDPDSGTPVFEAVERVFSVPGFARMLSQAGFAVRKLDMSGFLLSSLLPRSLHASKPVFGFLTSLNNALKKLPLLKHMGTVHTIVAQKVIDKCGPPSDEGNLDRCES